jgi:hypothetical protein
MQTIWTYTTQTEADTFVRSFRRDGWQATAYRAGPGVYHVILTPLA